MAGEKMGGLQSDGEEYSVIGDEADVVHIDYQDDPSVLDVDVSNEGPVVISCPFPTVEGKPRSIVAGETAVDVITVTNTTDDPIDLWAVKIYTSTPSESFALSLTEPPSDKSDEATLSFFFETMSLEDRVLQGGQTIQIWLSCKPKDIGLHTCIIHFDAGNKMIERVVVLLADDKLSQLLAPSRPYNRGPRRRAAFNTDKFVRGVPVPEKRGTQGSKRGVRGSKYGLPEFPIPEEVKRLVENKQLPDILFQQLSSENYVTFFTTLLNIEELHIKDAMREHDMHGVGMEKIDIEFLTLDVPGLAEKRPSLICGDYVFAKRRAEDDTQPYEGIIHRVEAEKVFLKFAKEFHRGHREGSLYDVSFTYNRLNMRRLYQAVESANNLGNSTLFPPDTSRRRLNKATPLAPFTEDLNEEQASAINMILKCRGSPPYIIYGPPGTGKTITLVEAILQVCATRRGARILVCASSNCAADHILMKIAPYVKANDIFRLNAYTRPYEDVPFDVLSYSCVDDSVFRCPPLGELSRYKIIVSTYMSASSLFAMGMRKGHFSHIMLDEAGQASEPETLIPVSNLSDRETVVVLAGDPLQLGPIVHSREAETYGLGKSFLERLSDCEIYSRNDRNFMTKLVRNYRCHPSILELPSRLFYNKELIACKEEEDDISIHDWPDLPNKEFPVVFYGIQGCDEREGNNPSWFNRIEVSKVVKIVQNLKDCAKVLDEDIGVISPYRQQVLKLKKVFETMELSDIKVGSVEQFQGQEKQIIIISTVRSTVKYDAFDQKHHLGFLCNPKRFNVAITRARSLLIIVGNPHVICKDVHWNQLLGHCTEHDSYQGCPLPQPDVAQYEEEYQDENEYNASEGYTHPCANEACGGGNVEYEDLPKPVTDEAEWSDGWK
ncbi:probable RNA helicase SDE3 [Nymphaea colorata]|nr:probable RNA helicase SDE3 [Nymphaea colorata]XP_031475279.1 probable RNA helicase SDE3 [Nymphaea colorata]XP_031475280.1 probable RNA helicase SDE3 [Nymphaea colorata]XP_031475281.1 probable RNA helicase SDE3 [Nymphaea colorata]XP_049931869.1 probable RNA helicase SDE3 [Nymphaea colorata]